jgi:hypothetical protein
MIRRIGLFLCALTLAGCKNLAWGPYVSPRVTGQVLAADTRRPLAGVKVARGRPEPRPLAGWPPRGGELLVRKPPTLTGPRGQFVLESERVLTLVRWGGWSSVRLTFERTGYLRFQTNYSLSSLAATNTPDGVPLLDAGQVLLQAAPGPGRRR